MANKRGKAVDTTYLSMETAAERGWIHRDYIAHCLRWQHVLKRVRSPKFKDEWLLDVGCGEEAPLPLTLYSNRLSHNGGSGGYVGVDYGKAIKPHASIVKAAEKGSFNAKFLPGYDFGAKGVSELMPVIQFDWVTCFEVVEHVEPSHALGILKQIRAALKPTGTAFISTPVYDPQVGAADNHVNEMSFQFMRVLLEAAGLAVAHAYGTFASQKDIKPRLKEDDLLALFEQLGAYHDTNVLANLFAPLYPADSRNCLWVVQQGEPSESFNEALWGEPRHSSSVNLAAELQKITAALSADTPKPAAKKATKKGAK